MVYNFLKLIFSIRPDIVHIGTAHGFSYAKHAVLILIARILRIPVLLQLHCGVDALIPSHSPMWCRFVFFIMRQCQGIIVLSTEWLQIQPILPDIKVSFIPNAIDTSPYIVIQREMESQSDVVVKILYLGHIGEAKGIRDLLSAVQQMRDYVKSSFTLDLVGESMKAGESDDLQAYAQLLGLDGTVCFHAPEYDDAKIARMGQADIFVLPSHSEGMPITILEAMASGLPIVATRVGGIPDMISNNETGLLIEPKCPDYLAKELARLVDEPHMRYELGANARESVQARFHIDMMIKSLYQFYNEVCMRARN
ncbi:Glycosyltransferase involved in cell wall bisynthesis [Syntrophus gentianae]|uniref:Glycosyltransferase involved in cell wall bisynthesis n=2 Tax=Syntrophus gentianae TaxID=43775 RepID=A0A1H7Y9B2_9BACT|nr:Glycosyltransferase involved in cell wall bisynthesis [Syntrophus gentianae]